MVFLKGCPDIHNTLVHSALKNPSTRMLGQQPDDRETGAKGEQEKRQNLECPQRLTLFLMDVIDAIITPDPASCRSPGGHT
jgi:hypothetical protein